VCARVPFVLQTVCDNEYESIPLIPIVCRRPCLASHFFSSVGGFTTSCGRPWLENLAFTRYSFTSRLLCTLYYAHTCIAHTVSILLQSDCAVFDTPRTPRFYTRHCTILCIAISCEGEEQTRRDVEYESIPLLPMVFGRLCLASHCCCLGGGFIATFGKPW